MADNMENEQLPGEVEVNAARGAAFEQPLGQWTLLNGLYQLIRSCVNELVPW